MKSPRCLLPLVALLTFCLDTDPVRSASADSEAPNVLLIITDEHNFRTLGCYRELMPREQAEMWGEGAVVPTPNIDRLAEQGVICTRAYATAPVCSPCRAAMITGRYPHATGVPTNNLILDRSIPTLADRLNDHGYRTGFVGKWHLGGEGKPEWAPKVDGGFQFKKFMFNRGHWKNFVLNNGEPAVGPVKKGTPSYDVAGADEKTFSTDFLTDRAIEFMTDEQSKPFFTVLSYPDPHGPNTVRSPYDHRFDDLPFVAPRTYQTGLPSPRWLGGTTKKHPVFRGSDMSAYFGMVQCIDDNIGRILAALKKDGKLENTLIILTSDHGDLCYEHDRQNKGNPYEGSARVPMILRQPGRIDSKQVYRDPVGTVDVTPTVMGLLRLPADKDDQGRDLSATLADVPEDDKEERPITFLRNSGMSAGWVAAVDSRYKLILSVNDVPWLLDSEQDPDELHNFYGRPGTDGVAERLAKALQAYGKRVDDPHLKNAKIAASLARVLGEPVSKSAEQLRSKWAGSRLWIGPEWWANPMTDWSLRNGAVLAPAAKDRTLCLLPAELGSEGEDFEISVDISRRLPTRKAGADNKDNFPGTAAGFRIGRRGGIDDFRHALVHARQWITAAIGGDGKLRLDDVVSDQAVRPGKNAISLTLAGRRSGDSFELTLTAKQDQRSVRVQKTVDATRVGGGVAILSDGPMMPGGGSARVVHAFENFSIGGTSVARHDDRSFGPILWSQYSLNGGQVRLQAQFAPLGPRQNHKAELWVGSFQESESYEKVAEATLDKLSRTATFQLDDWNGGQPKPYQVRFSWRGTNYAWGGTIRKEPDASEPLKLGCFSCDNGYLFPIPAMVEQVKKQDPDMMFFAGDQIYESYGGFGVARSAETETAMIDFLRKYYQFGWTWRDLLRDRPSVILPDDHDVFQGNLWGQGGRKLPPQEGKPDWTFGGYLMPARWVNAVERIHVGHLPDPVTPVKSDNGIQSYFTDLVYGGVGFAVVEDRKFKTGPKSMPLDNRTAGNGADLLGAEQEAFLKSWSENWDGHQMKCVLSQTIFCRAATHTGQNLKRTKSYFDSGAWPIAARNRAVRLMGNCNAFSIHGDQHLGVLLRQGVDDFDDANYAFMVPGTANGFPRAWWPGVEKGEKPEKGTDYTGKFRDSAGHPIHVLAVGNPEPGSNLLPKTNDPMEIGYRKGSGYGMVEFDKKNHDVKVSLYRLGNNEEMFPGFPQTLHVGGPSSER